MDVGKGTGESRRKRAANEQRKEMGVEAKSRSGSTRGGKEAERRAHRGRRKESAGGGRMEGGTAEVEKQEANGNQAKGARMEERGRRDEGTTDDP